MKVGKEEKKQALGVGKFAQMEEGEKRSGQHTRIHVGGGYKTNNLKVRGGRKRKKQRGGQKGGEVIKKESNTETHLLKTEARKRGKKSKMEDRRGAEMF